MLKRLTAGFTTLQQYLYVICLLIFSLHQVLQLVFHYNLPWANAWLDPFLFPLLLLPLILAEQRFVLRNSGYFFPPLLLTGYFVVLSLLSEYLFPLLSHRFSQDPLDVALMLGGTVLFYFIYRK